MTKRTCYSCGTVFEGGFSMFTCSVCQQTKAITNAMKKQAELAHKQQTNSYPFLDTDFTMPRSGGYYPTYTDNTTWERVEYTPPPPLPPEVIEKGKQLRFLDSLLDVLFWSSPLWVLPLLWLITSGWFTFFSFVAFPFAFIGAGKYHHYWKRCNAYYLYTIRGRT